MSILNNLKEIRKIDKENMLELLLSFSDQLNEALSIGVNFRIPRLYLRHYHNIIFVGLGGSAIGADIIRDTVREDVKIPVIINRNYTAPGFVDGNTLAFVVSYSGNTEESLSAYKDIKKKGAKIITVTSGGKLEKMSRIDKVPVVKIPPGYPPRCALLYLFVPVLIAFSWLKLIPDRIQDIKNASLLLTGLKRKIGIYATGRANTSKQLARFLHRKFPVIYSSERIKSVATRWRGQFAENSKTLTSSHFFPEMNHNEIVGWMFPKSLLRDFVAVILKTNTDHPRIKKRMEITGSILKKEGYAVFEIEAMGRNIIEQVLSLIYIGDFASFYLAILNRVNPTPVDRITYLKKKLAQ